MLSEVFFVKLITAPGKMHGVNPVKADRCNSQYAVADFGFAVFETENALC